MLENRADTVWLSSRVKPGREIPTQAAERLVTADVLQKTARRMEPFYCTIAVNRRFAEKWSDAVVKLDLERMQRLLKAASPKTGTNFPGTNGIGYFVGSSFPAPVDTYASGTTIPPGTVQFVFEPRAHRSVAAAVLPLYRTISLNRRFALALARAIREEDGEAVAYYVRSRVKSNSLRSVAIEQSGIALTFRFAFSKHTYRNLLFRDVPEEESRRTE